MNLADLHTELHGLKDLAGVPPGQRAFLLNEGYNELYTQAEWGRALVSTTTVAGQVPYAIPQLDDSTGERVLKVWVDNLPYEQSSDDQTGNLAIGDLRLDGYGLYYLRGSESGDEFLFLYPTPTVSGKAIDILLVREPAPLTLSTDVPKLPARFHRAIVDYAASQAYGAAGNPDAQAFYQERFNAKVVELFRLRNARAGRGPVQMQVEGWHY